MRSYNRRMPEIPLGIGPAGVLTAQAVTRSRAARGFAQRQLAERVTALGRPMTITMLSRIERAQRRCDVDDLLTLAQALRVPTRALLQDSATC